MENLPSLLIKQNLTEDVCLVEFMHRVAYFTCMPGKNYRRRLVSLLSCLCDVFRGLINSLVCSFILFFKCSLMSTETVGTISDGRWFKTLTCSNLTTDAFFVKFSLLFPVFLFDFICIPLLLITTLTCYSSPLHYSIRLRHSTLH